MIDYPVKTEVVYKIDGYFWRGEDTPVPLYLENLDYGGYVQGVLLRREDDGELRIVSERLFDNLSRIEREKEPREVYLSLRKPTNNDGKLTVEAVNERISEALNFEYSDQVDDIRSSIIDPVFVLRLNAGVVPLRELTSKVEGAIRSIGSEVIDAKAYYR